MTGTIRKIGGSLAVIIPKGMAEGFSAGQQVELSEKPDGILLSRRPRRAKRAMADIVRQMDAKAYKKVGRDFLEEGPVGREVW